MEIAADAEGRLPANLIRAAYLASRSGTVALVLTDISSVTIDRLLDEIVSTALDVRGVLYCTAEDVDRLICDRGRPLVALGSAERLRRALVGHHVDMIPCAQGADVLASLSMGKAAPGPPGARIPRHAV